MAKKVRLQRVVWDTRDKHPPTLSHTAYPTAVTTDGQEFSEMLKRAHFAGTTTHVWQHEKRRRGKLPAAFFIWDNGPPAVTGHLRQDRHQRAAVASWSSKLLLELE